MQPNTVIVSNRLPVSVKKVEGNLEFSASIGGLATGLSSYVQNRRNSWIGWPGIANEELTEKDKETITTELAKHNCTPVFLSKKQLDDFYSGYSNSILWPLFHNLPYKDKDTTQHKRWWQAYRAVNRAFAEAVLNISEHKSRIWVHDYQLLLLPEMLRTELPAATIGFFLHIPFPDAKSFGDLPEHKKLIQGMLGADLIGFHTNGYVDAFIENCQAMQLSVIGNSQVVLQNRAVRIGNFPMGIDYKKYADSSKSKVVKAAVSKYRKRYRGLKVIAAVDRMDPSKGLVERLKAYRELLEQNPRMRGKVIFSLIAAPSRTDVEAYQRLSKKLDTLVAEINEKYGSRKWTPVDYMNFAQPFEEVTALFQVADVAFIAPLKDGMNLAAKEYVASRRKNGVLILSETAGAAEELRDALIVNPRKPASLVEGLQLALTMPKPELKGRLRSMQQHLSTNTVQVWAKTFVETLQQPVPGTPPLLTKTLRTGVRAGLVRDFRRSQQRLLLLDYDGVLTPFVNKPAKAFPSKDLLKLLTKLAHMPNTDVVITSGRSKQELEEWFGDLPIGLAAEHGALVRRKDGKTWRKTSSVAADWKKQVLPVLEEYAGLTPGAFVEQKGWSLVWHYRQAQAYYAQKHLVILKRLLRPLAKKYGIIIENGNKILEVRPRDISKANAVRHWLDSPYGFMMAIGDDFTDEDTFAAMPASAYSIKVGRGRTNAAYRLQKVPEVLKLLRDLAR